MLVTCCLGNNTTNPVQVGNEQEISHLTECVQEQQQSLPNSTPAEQLTRVIFIYLRCVIPKVALAKPTLEPQELIQLRCSAAFGLISSA